MNGPYNKNDHERILAYLQEELSLSSDAAKMVKACLAAPNMFFSVSAIGFRSVYRKSPSLYYIAESLQIAQANRLDEVHLPLEIILKIILLSSFITEGIHLLAQPIEKKQHIYEAVWATHGNTFASAVENFMEGDGTLLQMFRSFEDTIPIAQLAAEVNQHLARTLAWGQWTRHIIRMISSGCYLFICAHECAHITMGHVMTKPLLDRESSEQQSRIRSGQEIEADVMAYSHLSNFTKLLAVEVSESFKVSGSGDMLPLLEADHITDRTVLGVTNFAIRWLRSFWMYNHKGTDKTLQDLRVRSYMLEECAYDYNLREIIRVEPDYLDVEWMRGYLIGRNAMEFLILNQIFVKEDSINESNAIPPYCLGPSSDALWSIRPPYSQSWAVLDGARKWTVGALQEIYSTTSNYPPVKPQI